MKAGTRASARNWRSRSAPATGKASAPMPTMSASSSALRVSRGPIFGLVARLVHQKGIDLVLSAADEIIDAGGQIVVTGTGEPEIEQALVDAHRRRPDAIRRRDRLQRRPGAAHLCRQRLHADAVALRAVRAEPDVCAALRLAADRPPDRRPGGDHHRRRDRIPVCAALDRVLPRRRPPRLLRLHVDASGSNSMRRSAMARSFSWDLSAACYNALYRKAVSP